MSVLILNSLTENSHLVEEVKCQIGKRAAQIDLFNLADERIQMCRSCDRCSCRTPGRCAIQDKMQTILPLWVKANMVVLITTIFYGTYDSLLKKVIERLMPLNTIFFTVYKGELHHRNRYQKTPILAGLGVTPQRHPDESDAFKLLIKRNAINLFIEDYRAEVFRTDEAIDNIKVKLDQIFSER